MSPEPAKTKMASIDRARTLIERRLADLDQERERLQAALGELQPRSGRRTAPPARPRRGRRARRGQRQAEFLASLRASPGASIAEIARDMGVKPQQLYAVARRLTASGDVTKRDGAYVAVDPSSGSHRDG